MKRTALPRTGVAVAASALSLALVTGCGGSDSGSGTGSGSGSGTSDGKEKAAAKALTEAELDKAILAKGDVKKHKVEEIKAADAFAASKDQVEVEDGACGPFGYILSGFAPGDSSAFVKRMVQEEPTVEKPSTDDLENFEDAFMESMDITTTFVGLSSYEGDGAEKTMADVTAAAEKCAGGFSASAKGEEQKFTAIAPEKASGAGDESQAYVVTGLAEGAAKGDPYTVHVEVVRHGTTIASYFSYNLASMAGEKGKDEKVPAALIEKQTAKLG